MKEFDSAVIEILAANARDMPFAALYHVEEASSKFKSRLPVMRLMRCRLETGAQRPDAKQY
jgi:hypothetical protein